ncbi:LGFP repeat-containing protein [Streptomyces cylindrosporus]|uniref:Uncharacterized protein n=1 Tax=Streptomyces cylindrosporus TaxID=2927583 RepID=A0ABS9YGA2_9ACTN|nr:hypothetical protein [Streptomyces cylindrosporus]MCI3275636.1 hypothetical protein [Streptomyces cylindrosporus]
MLSLKRRAAGVVLGSLLALGGTAAVPAVADAPQMPAKKLCLGDHRIDNAFIYRRWQQLGGSDGAMGCPVNDNFTLPNGAERQTFEHGQLAWSPDQGHRMVVAAWQDGGYAYFTWGPTDPYHYDTFLVRYTSAANPFGTQKELGKGNHGGMWVQRRTTGSYKFVVEGCDTGTFGHTCRQGWTTSVRTYPY